MNVICNSFVHRFFFMKFGLVKFHLYIFLKRYLRGFANHAGFSPQARHKKWTKGFETCSSHCSLQVRIFPVMLACYVLDISYFIMDLFKDKK